MVLSIAMASTFMAQAGKTSGGTTTTGAFTFNYNVGTTVQNYHAYGFACQVGAVSTRPSGTVALGTLLGVGPGPRDRHRNSHLSKTGGNQRPNLQHSWSAVLCGRRGRRRPGLR